MAISERDDYETAEGFLGGFQAFRRAVPAPPNAMPVARFLLYERAYPDSVAASVDAVHNVLVRANHNPRSSEPVLRLQRLSADLEFRGRAEAVGNDLHATCEAVQEELVRVDRDIAERYFAGATRSRSRPMPGSRRCCRPGAGAGSRCGSAPTRRTAGWRGRRTSRSATGAVTPTSRRSRASTAGPQTPISTRR
jgi:hypothetical protein